MTNQLHSFYVKIEGVNIHHDTERQTEHHGPLWSIDALQAAIEAGRKSKNTDPTKLMHASVYACDAVWEIWLTPDAKEDTETTE
jgi:uncharacterized OsmC-like protein